MTGTNRIGTTGQVCYRGDSCVEGVQLRGGPL